MKALDIVLAPLILMIILAISYAYVLGGSQSEFTKNLVNWAVIFVIFAIFARMCVPH